MKQSSGTGRRVMGIVSKPNKPVEKMVEEWASEIKRTIDLRYSNGEWCVMTAWGNIMVTVPGTIQPTLRKAVEAAVERWANRSPSSPF